METFRNGKVKMEPWIETSSGKLIWFDGRPNVFDIKDIAHALANMCRYTGHCRYFYSVAEHSVNVSLLLPDDLALAGLLHDASEAYLADIASPVKQLLPDYKKMEAMITKQINEQFGIETDHPTIKRADWSQLKEEARFLLPSGGRTWFFPNDLEDGVIPVGLSPNDAEHNFITTYIKLTKGIKHEQRVLNLQY